MISDDERRRCDELAQKLGTYIPGYMSEKVWSLPILEAIVSRLEAIEEKLKEIS